MLIFWANFCTELRVGFLNKPPNEKDHLGVIQSMQETMIGIGDLLAQNVLFASTAAGVELPLTFFNNCTPGSSKHASRS
jgi:hypothetical protein